MGTSKPPATFEKLSHVGHATMSLCNPLSESKLQHLLRLLPLREEMLALDIGCGKGEMLIRLAERFGLDGVGIDISEAFLQEAREQARLRVPRSKLDFLLGDMRQISLLKHHFDIGMCVGATQAIGSMTLTLARLKELVRPGGLILLAEGFWRRPPAAEYLEFLQCDAQLYRSHSGNVELGQQEGLTYLFGLVCEREDFDIYEGTYLLNIENYCEAHPDEPDCETMLRRIRRWHSHYLRYGRDTLGFGFYVFRTPSA
ncbi:MAG: methyltransferase domain-containing protein [Myxococcales bacterium]|nr:methyltransferase domain-containing protein [Myxococcales bacterium]MCB9643914.1 methyltransferase domain-containing protein [Myxococcales bacterium]